MANKNRAAGDRFEYKVRDMLVDAGWFVMRSPASKSAVDLFITRAGRDHGCSEVLFVQCKTNGRLDPGEWDNLVDLAVQFGADPVLAYRPSRGMVRFLLLTGHKERGRRLDNQPVQEIEPT